MRQIKKGSTDQSVVIRIVDSGDGTPETGVVYNTSGIDLWYRREGATVTSITEASLSALGDAHADGGLLHIGNGYYRLDLPDAAVASGANGVLIGGTVTGMVVIGCYVQLVGYDPQDGTRLGLTALPNAAAEAAGGLITRGTGTGQMTLSSGKVTTGTNDDKTGYSLTNLTVQSSTTLATGTHNPQSGDAFSRIGSTGSGLTSLAPASTALSTAQWTNTRAGYLDNLSGGAVALASGVSVSSGGIISSSFASGAITAAAIASDAFTAAKFASDVTTEFQSGLATASALATVSGKIDTIDDFLDTEIAAILADTNELQTDWANGGRLDLILDARASQSSIDAIDGIVDDILVIAEKLDTALEDDGASGWQFTALALDNAPSGGGGGTDWTSDERTAIRAILGIPGSGTTPADPSTGILDAIRDAIAVVDGVADAILVDTAEIGTAGAGLTALAQASIWTSTIAGRIDAAVSTRASQTSVDDVPTNAEFAAAFPSNFAALGINASGHVSRVTLADTLTTYTSNTPQTGDAYARIGANGAGLTAIPWNASWDAEVQSEVTDALNAALTEGYRAAGSTGSVAQLLYEISAHLGRMAIAGTTKTLKKLDNSTTAKTFTLDDDTAPTAIEETT